MQAGYPLKEGVGDGRGGLGVADGDEVSIFGEAADDGEDDGFPVDFGQGLDENHRDVGPHLGQHVEGLKEAHPAARTLSCCAGRCCKRA